MIGGIPQLLSPSEGRDAINPDLHFFCTSSSIFLHYFVQYFVKSAHFMQYFATIVAVFHT